MKIEYAMGRVEGDEFIVEVCPLCGETHTHSAYAWTPIRVAHCDGNIYGHEYLLWNAQTLRPQFKQIEDE